MIIINATSQDIQIDPFGIVVPARSPAYVPDVMYVNNVQLRQKVDELLANSTLIMPPTPLPVLDGPLGNRGSQEQQ